MRRTLPNNLFKTSAQAAKAAMAYIGKPYSWLDYAAIAAAAHSWHLWAPGLKHSLASTKHLIGSQQVDRAERDGGVHLFADRRWPGFVRPSDLADLIVEVRPLPPRPPL